MTLPIYGSSVHTSFSDLSSASDAARASSQALNAEQHAKLIEQRLDRILLVMEAMWDLLRDKNGLSEQALLDQVNVRAKNRVDQLQSPEATKCPQCGRPMPPKIHKCLYCGATRPIATVFDAV
jgi:ribosomal protein L32